MIILARLLSQDVLLESPCSSLARAVLLCSCLYWNTLPYLNAACSWRELEWHSVPLNFLHNCGILERALIKKVVVETACNGFVDLYGKFGDFVAWKEDQDLLMMLLHYKCWANCHVIKERRIDHPSTRQTYNVTTSLKNIPSLPHTRYRFWFGGLMDIWTLAGATATPRGTTISSSSHQQGI